MATQNLANGIYETLKQKILYCEIPPGRPVSEKQLMEMLKVGRTPLREAVLTLKKERLIVVLPRRGMLVAELSLPDVIENYQVREIMETAVLTHTCKLIEQKTLAELEELFQSIYEQREQFDTKEYLEHDWRFHYSLIEPLRNKKISEFLHQIYEQNIRFRISCYRQRQVQDMVGEHLEIIRFIKAGDADGACKALRTHIINSRDAVVSGHNIVSE